MGFLTVPQRKNGIKPADKSLEISAETASGARA